MATLGSWKEISALYWAGIFVCLQWGGNRRIASYVTVATSLKADKKTSKIG